MEFYEKEYEFLRKKKKKGNQIIYEKKRKSYFTGRSSFDKFLIDSQRSAIANSRPLKNYTNEKFSRCNANSMLPIIDKNEFFDPTIEIVR